MEGVGWHQTERGETMGRGGAAVCASGQQKQPRPQHPGLWLACPRDAPVDEHQALVGVNVVLHVCEVARICLAVDLLRA